MSIPSTAPLRDWLGSGDLALGVTTPGEPLPGPLADQGQRWCQSPPSLLHWGASFRDWLIASSSRDSIKSGPKAGRCHRWPRSWVRGWAQQTDGIGRAMALGPGGPMALGPFRMAAPMGLKEALRQQAAVLRQVASWPGAGALVPRPGPRAANRPTPGSTGGGGPGCIELRP